MLIKFAVKNFRGFAERIEWDLSSPNNYTWSKDVISDGIIKNGIIYGPNGAGKTNFSLALFDIINHLTNLKARIIDYQQNYVYVGNPGSGVHFEYTFKFGKQIIEYQYIKDAHAVLKQERLTVDGVDAFNRNNSTFYLDEKQFPINPSAKRDLRDNSNNISIVNYLLNAYPLSKDHYLIKLSDFVNSMLWFRSVQGNTFMGLETTPTFLDEFIIKNNLVEDFQKFLKEISNQDFSFVKPQVNDKALVCKYKKGTIRFDLIASTGTHSLRLLYYWHKKMDRTSFVFIDEFDAFYHFKLAFEVCKLLFNLKCQVFTSSHNTYLMTNDLLRPDCNFILQNNKIKPLQACTEKELRFGHNIEKIYKAGAFHVE
ncbi:MAG: ATP-binding protein [Bacteroidaceae bacterium]|nr:ATP-binding protein [Bacteroidaceae bacterium]